MHELLYCLGYVLENNALLKVWVDIEVEMVSVCVICTMRTAKVSITFCGITQLIEAPYIIFRGFKKYFRERV